MDVQGWVVIGLALLMFGYLVPHLVMSRQQLAEARVEDRFSTALRVVTTGTTMREAAPVEHHGASGTRPYLHDPRRRTESSAVKRPTTAGERAATEARRLAAARAARAAEISRRQAAARRRLVLTVVLLLATVGGWVAFGAASMSIALGLVPTVLLGAVLVAGRRAAKIAARRNAADRAAMARLQFQPAPRTRPTTTTAGDATEGEGSEHAAATASGADDVAGRDGDVVGEDGAGERSRAGADEQAATVRAEDTGGDWMPVPVPAPTYTLKATAPRRDVAPYPAPHAPTADASRSETAPVSTPAAPVVAAPETSGLAGSPYAPAALTEAEMAAAPAPRPEPAPAGGIDLDSVLARRRALGA